MPRTVLSISGEGVVQFVYADELQPLLDEGRASIRRASHVEPNERGEWTADLSPIGGPTFGPFATRAGAIAHEVETINARLAAGETL